MTVVGIVVELALWLFILLLLTRIVADWVQMFARSWSPRGPVLLLLEVTYTVTDPPIKLLRRVIPPLRIGGVALDLSILIVLLVAYVLSRVNQEVLLFG